MPTVDWFVPVARVGSKGVQDYVAKSNIAVIKSDLNQELFLFINYPVIGVPILWDIFYRASIDQVEVLISETDTDDG